MARVTARGSKKLNRTKGDYLSAYLMILPLAAGMLIFYVIPVFQTIYFSFLDMGAFGPASWIGTRNYLTMLKDRTLWQAFVNTFVYVLIAVPLTVTLSILVAVLLNTNIRGRGAYRTLFFLPCVTMPVAIAMVWAWLFNSSYGLMNTVLGVFGIKAVAWTTDPRIAIYSIILVVIWSSVGRYMVIALAGLQGIPDSYYEAASIDGAKAFRKFYSITLPLLSPTIYFILIIAVISTLQIFDVVYMIVPKDSIAAERTQSLVVLFYRSAVTFGEKGYGSTIAIMILLVSLMFTAIQMKLHDTWVTYN
jgi:multiple sugar transport system permease protein